MTVTAPAGPGLPEPSELVTVTIDGVDVAVPKGTLVIRAAELIGVEIPRFCDHPLLEPVAACRACLVEIEGMPKPQPSCAIVATQGMAVRTGGSSPVAKAAQEGVMEFLLINHPLDCPVCDKGGECPLQNQAMSAGRGESRFGGAKRTFPKPINVSAAVLLDRERCVSCARCTRFAEQIAGDPLIGLLERGAKQQVGIGAGVPFDSYFSGNTIQICPVGALTSTRYRFRARPFDLVSVPTACEHCAAGCALRTDYRRGVVTRRQAWEDPAVNEDWNCDKGRFAFDYLDAHRLAQPMVREDGQLRPASWPEALDVAARGLAAARGRAGVLTGGRLTLQDATAYARFARVALASDDIDFRARAASAEEADYLRSAVAGTGLGVTYAELERASVVLLVGLDPEEESPIVFLRLRKAARRNATRVVSVAPYATPGTTKADGTLVPTVPGAEAAVLDALAADGTGLPVGTPDGLGAELAAALREPGAVVLAGERLAGVPGGLSALARLVAATGCRSAWVPRRAGERAALDAGALPGLLPGGRPLTDPVAREEVAAAWGVAAADLPAAAGLGHDAMVAAVLAHAETVAADPDGEVDPARVAALVVGGVEPADLPDPASFLAALDATFVVSLETRPSAVTQRADVVLPVAVVTEKAGAFVDWEGRPRPFGRVFDDRTALSDARVLDLVGQAMGLGEAEYGDLGGWHGARPAVPDLPAADPPSVPDGQAVLASWRHLLDLGVMQQGDDDLAATRRTPVARASAATAAGAGVRDGDPIVVTGPAGSVTLPLAVTDMVDGVVWLPGNSEGSSIHRDLGAVAGAVVRIGGAA